MSTKLHNIRNRHVRIYKDAKDLYDDIDHRHCCECSDCPTEVKKSEDLFYQHHLSLCNIHLLIDATKVNEI